MAGYAAGVNESVLWQGIIFASVSRTRARNICCSVNKKHETRDAGGGRNHIA